MVDEKVSRNDPCPCGSGLKYKKCCLLKSIEGTALETPERFGPQPVFYDDTQLIRPPVRPRPKMHGMWRVRLEYTFPETYGVANINYHFPLGRLLLLVSGAVIPVERAAAGMAFLMEDGQIATVTAMHAPKWWDPPPDKPIRDDLYKRRVLGTVEHVGNVVMDVFFAGQKVTTTPNHLWYSVSRNCYVPAETLRAGEDLKDLEGRPLRCEGISPPRYGLVKLYNLEVEQFHNYFVGGQGAAAQVHNGIPGASCGMPMPAQVDEAADAAATSIVRLSRAGRATYAGMEVRGVRSLSHIDESTLLAMAEKGFAAKDLGGRSLVLHHLGQNPAGPLVEIPAPFHNISNRIQHPLGNAPGAGLSAEQRAAFDVWRSEYWKARAVEELHIRGTKI